jgi:hypothetical protein
MVTVCSPGFVAADPAALGAGAGSATLAAEGGIAGFATTGSAAFNEDEEASCAATTPAGLAEADSGGVVVLETFLSRPQYFAIGISP